MSSEGSITRPLRALEEGDRAAAQALWDRFFQRLVSLARSNLQGAPRQVADEEDVALSAFASFCRCAENGQFTDLHDRDSLWRMLVHITCNKAVSQIRHDKAIKRGGAAGPPGNAANLEQLIGREPTPELAAQLAEERQQLLGILANPEVGDPQLPEVAALRMDGHSNEEIAARLGCSLPTVKRKLRVIRSLWTPEIPS